MFNFGFAAHSMLGTAMTFHMAKIGALHGLDAHSAFAVFLPVAVVSTCCDLGGGIVSDRVPMRYLLMVMQAGLCLGLLSLDHLGTRAGFWLTAVGFGVSGGLFSLLMGAAWPKLFGRTHLGAIAGANMAWVVGGSAVGPWLFSEAEAWTGHFATAFHWGLVAPAAVLVAAAWARVPDAPPAADPAAGGPLAGVRAA